MNNNAKPYAVYELLPNGIVEVFVSTHKTLEKARDKASQDRKTYHIYYNTPRDGRMLVEVIAPVSQDETVSD